MDKGQLPETQNVSTDSNRLILSRTGKHPRRNNGLTAEAGSEPRSPNSSLYVFNAAMLPLRRRKKNSVLFSRTSNFPNFCPPLKDTEQRQYWSAFCSWQENAIFPFKSTSARVSRVDGRECWPAGDTNPGDSCHLGIHHPANIGCQRCKGKPSWHFDARVRLQLLRGLSPLQRSPVSQTTAHTRSWFKVILLRMMNLWLCH